MSAENRDNERKTNQQQDRQKDRRTHERDYRASAPLADPPSTMVPLICVVPDMIPPLLPFILRLVPLFETIVPESPPAVEVSVVPVLVSSFSDSD